MSGRTKTEQTTIGSYHAGHPWYYLLGNPVLTPKQIRDAAIAGSYRGYLEEDIRAIGKKPEPKRSQAVRAMREKVKVDLVRDISRYREVAFKLHAHRREHGIPANPTCCDDIHTATSLKHAHIFNGFAHLAALDELPSQQADLFG